MGVAARSRPRFWRKRLPANSTSETSSSPQPPPGGGLQLLTVDAARPLGCGLAASKIDLNRGRRAAALLLFRSVRTGRAAVSPPRRPAPRVRRPARACPSQAAGPGIIFNPFSEPQAICTVFPFRVPTKKGRPSKGAPRSGLQSLCGYANCLTSTHLFAGFAGRVPFLTTSVTSCSFLPN